MPTWQPTSSSAGPDDQQRCGTLRSTMKTNPLLARAELGKVKPCTFNNASEDYVFGYSVPKDSEGAREVTMIWKEHKPSPGPYDATAGKVQADFKRINKEAAKSGLTTAKQQPAFRAANMVTIKQFDHTKRVTPVLPSEANPAHVYGIPSSHRSPDTIRACGPAEPPVKHLIQGAYQDEWIQSNLAQDTLAGQGVYIPPVPTRATLGHAIGATKYTQRCHGGEEWKMTKFKKVGSRVTQYMGSTGKAGSKSPEAYDDCADQQNWQQTTACEDVA